MPKKNKQKGKIEKCRKIYFDDHFSNSLASPSDLTTLLQAGRNTLVGPTVTKSPQVIWENTKILQKLAPSNSVSLIANRGHCGKFLQGARIHEPLALLY